MTATEIEYEGVTVPNVVGTPRETALRIVLAERVAVARELDEIRANAKVVLDRQRALVRLSQDIAAHASVPDDIVKPFFKGVGGKNPLDSSRKRHESLEAEETETAEVFATFCRKVSGNAPAEWGLKPKPDEHEQYSAKLLAQNVGDETDPDEAYTRRWTRLGA